MENCVLAQYANVTTVRADLHANVFSRHSFAVALIRARVEAGAPRP
jgi:hypothetical protein